MRAAIVTGVSRGLGEALAAALLGRGFAVLGVGRTASAKLKGKLYLYATGVRDRTSRRGRACP